jgi:hypothetical protein
MMRNAITVRRGLLAGAAVGVALVVMWRRSRESRDAVAPAAPARPPFEPAAQAEEPMPEPLQEPMAERQQEPVLEQEPVLGHEEQAPEPVAAETVAAAPIAFGRAPGEHARHAVALTHTGRRREFGHPGWLQHRPAAVVAATRRTHAPPGRATWPGVAGARRGAFTRRP